MNQTDDATGLPINTCNQCKKEFLGWLEPYTVTICDECLDLVDPYHLRDCEGEE